MVSRSADFSSVSAASSSRRMALSHSRVIGGMSATFATTFDKLTMLPKMRFSTSGVSRAAFSTSADGGNRCKSTVAAYNTDSDDDEDDVPLMVHASNQYDGHAKAAMARSGAAGAVFSHEEAWMINLGRGDNNAWLTGPRNVDEWYTGLKPSVCPGADTKGKIRSLPLPRLDAVTREAAKEYFDNSWTLYETLFAGLNGEEYFYRPPVHGLRHPQIFYYGHTACLYVNKLRVSGVLDKPVNPYFESIFEVGVDEMLWDDMHKNVSFLWKEWECFNFRLDFAVFI